MGKLTITDGTIKRTITCRQFALMDYTPPAGWEVTESSCGTYYSKMRSPYASFGLDLSGSTLPGGWVEYKGTITSNQVVIPTDIVTLPSNVSNIFVYVRRQSYFPSVPGDARDFTVNNSTNTIEFAAGLNLNGQSAIIKVFK